MPTDPRDEITSVTNPRVKALVALRRRRIRQDQGVTLVEGYEELDLALTAGVRPTELYVCPDLSAGDPRAVEARAAELGAAVFRLSRPAFEKAAYREGPDGWLAVVPDVETDLADLPTTGNPLFVVCGGVEKPGNLGSILRTADAAGVTAVISVDPVTDWGNPNVVRASKGAVFSVPVASCDTAAFLDWLTGRGLTVVATTPDTETYVTGLDLSGPTAVLVGSEKYGLSADLLTHADARAKLPMFGRVDSLNVAVTAAVVTYECVRQRMAADS
ncbi:RNA methyltransferase [Phytomonospora sp. NPDC050363]|uniref:TrmH family RNA methyltransferase n=1 Tax=Phytomonospora sp. NPDC050363 TaxID=3155642 RepID=UPI0033E7FE4F